MNDQISAVIATFPETFGLRAFPGDKFTLNRAASYESGGQIMLYVYTADGLAFCKGSPVELRREVTSDVS